jgi:hypothetical protein
VDAAPDAMGQTTCSDTQSDAHNCGACGHDCLGVACSGGLCAPEAINPDYAGRLVADQDNLYFTAEDTAVYGVAKAGGKSFVVASQAVDGGVGGPYFLALSGGKLYWDYFLVTGTNNLDGSVFSAPTSARGATSTVLFSPTTRSPGFPIVNAAGVIGPNLYVAGDCTSIGYLPVTGGSAWTVANDFCDRKVANTVFDAPSSTAYSLRTTGSILTWSLPGGVPAQIPVNPGQISLPGLAASTMTVAGGKIYVVVQTSSMIFALYSMGLDGSAPTVVAPQLPTYQGSIYDLVVDGAYAFYLDQGGAKGVSAQIYRVTLATGEAISLYASPGNGQIHAYVPSAPYLYVADGGILRIAE